MDQRPGHADRPGRHHDRLRPDGRHRNLGGQFTTRGLEERRGEALPLDRETKLFEFTRHPITARLIPRAARLLTAKADILPEVGSDPILHTRLRLG